MRSIPQVNIIIKTRLVVEEIIDKTFPWGYFDGATIGEHRSCGVGGVIYIFEDYWNKFKVGLGEDTNNIV